MKYYLKQFIICSLLMTAATSVADGTRFVVDANSDSMDQAIQLARNGDTIYLKAGRYAKSIAIKPGVRLEGEGVDKVFILGNGRSTALLVSRDANDLAGFSEITGITIADCNKGGIYISGTKADISNCIIEDCNEEGLVVEFDAECRISNSVVRRCGKNGIRVASDSTIDVRGLDAADNKWSGVVVNAASSCTIKDSVLKGNYHGILGQGKAYNVSVDNTICASNSSCGMWFEEANSVKIRNSICVFNGSGGILVTNDTNEIKLTGNKCKANRGNSGIAVWRLRGKIGTAKINGNVCWKNQKNGIDVNAGDANMVIENNQCIGNVAGISVSESTTVRIIANKCKANRDHGVVIWGKSNVEFLQNDCFENNKTGLNLYESTATVRQNRLNSNGIHGLYALSKDTALTATDNECISNGKTGITVEKNAKAILFANRCLRNMWAGISVTETYAWVTIGSNTCENNGAWGIVLPERGNAKADENNKTNANGKGPRLDL